MNNEHAFTAVMMSLGFLLWIIHDISWWVMESRLKKDEVSTNEKASSEL